MNILKNYHGLHWQMSICEKAVLESVLRELKPDVSIEIGTYAGGSLQAISYYSGHVDSIDIDCTVRAKIAHLFDNVTFHSGDSKALLPEILRDNTGRKRKVGFVLIDGNHSTEGVRGDIDALLSVAPDCRRIVLLHDSFNPNCREGIRSARWSDSPFVHSVELDFVPGIYHQEAHDTASARTMWGGFACAIIEPFHRRDDLKITASQQGLFDAVYEASSHASSQDHSNIMRIARRLKALW